jgi:hypothetical protein
LRLPVFELVTTHFCCWFLNWQWHNFAVDF